MYFLLIDLCEKIWLEIHEGVIRDMLNIVDIQLEITYSLLERLKYF